MLFKSLQSAILQPAPLLSKLAVGTTTTQATKKSMITVTDSKIRANGANDMLLLHQIFPMLEPSF